ncbi:CapA family protein [Acetivibrio mesophilus]|uniref:CapA family protein n=1 Tax=Acetivibrio mesophilus TaxID=2487273 RepID=A0A4Q0I763_9FIRM|nr:CapA family protein [Acetivibrio mesophilus]ODM25646.1 poly-gamma-glutamate biosynthesis protein [Clostridium sp. Bc-iso-3]RXE60231.1 CapA family protein [Acetivibrio mesophilus]HHV29900.1 CapA family protein [Clostridium sp.]
MRKKYIILAVIALLVGVLALSACNHSSEKDDSIAVINEKDNEKGTNENEVKDILKDTVSDTVYNTLQPTATPVAEIKIVAVGDILLGRGVGMRLKSGNKDYIYPFLEVKDILKKGDVVFCNLEESITDSTHSLTGIKDGGKYVLKNDVEAIEGLKFAGFNLMNLANNHILDYYERGLFDTMEILDKNGIKYAGAGKNIEEAKKPAIMEVKGMKVGMLAYTDMAEVVYKGNPNYKFAAGQDKPGVAPRPLKFDDSIKKDIEQVRDEVDILIVSLHWGVEESFEVLPEQREFAYSLLDNGVDVILGHHPHQFQGIEIYNGKPIIYSMGNFIFDQNDPENQESFIITMDYKGNKLVGLEAIPVRTIGKIQVVPQKGNEAKPILEREKNLCNKLDTSCFIKDDKLYFELGNDGNLR